MNIDYNEKNHSIEMTNVLNFEKDVLPKIEQIKVNLSDFIEDDLVSPEDLEKYKAFLDENINERHICEIMCNIINNYENDNELYNASIFDESLIKKSINEFIEMEYEFDASNF